MPKIQASKTTSKSIRRLALSAGLYLFIGGILFVPLAHAEPILDSYGRIIGFTEPEEIPEEPEPAPKPKVQPEGDGWETDALIDDLKQRIDAKDTKIRNLRKRAESASNDLESARGRKRTLVGQVAYLNRQIDALELQIQITENQIDAIGLKVEELDLQIVAHEANIEKSRLQISELLRTMQLTEDQVGPVGLVFAAQPFSEIFDSIRASELLDASLGENLKDIKKEKEDVENARAESIVERDGAEALRDDLRVRRTLLEAEETGRDNLLSETRQEEGAYSNLLDEVEKQQREIEAEVRELESQLRRTIDPSSLPGSGVLSWPVDSTRVTQGYGNTSNTGFINDSYSFHNGFDIAALVRGVIGDPVRAAASGRVVGVGDDGRYAYGKWVAIDHLNGLVTLYGHLSLQQVSVGQEVQRDEVIARMGNSGFSTGAHVHFTVYAAETFRIESRWYGPLPIGASFNPQNFL